MATGITARERIARRTVPVFVSYEGKCCEEEILNRTYQKFVKISDINGYGDNAFYFGDNQDALLSLMNGGYKESISLIYIDPPYATSLNFVNREQEHAYSDDYRGGEYVEMLRSRLIIMRELLKPEGSIYLHLDGNMAFTMKLIMDEVFGRENCRAFITRKKCSTKNYTKNTFGNISDYVMFYTKSPNYIWNRPYTSWEETKMYEQYPCVDITTGLRYKKVPIHAPGTRNGATGKEWRGMLPPKGKHWQYTPDRLDEMDAAGEIYWSATGNPRRKVYCNQEGGIPIQDIWLDYRDSINQAQKTTGYPTEKNFEMLKMIVQTSSRVGDIVLDCFAGSGTTLGAAYELDRRWIGVDNSIESMKSVLKRFTTGLDIYGDYVGKEVSLQGSLDILPKCPFSLHGQEDDENIIKNLVLSSEL